MACDLVAEAQVLERGEEVRRRAGDHWHACVALDQVDYVAHRPLRAGHVKRIRSRRGLDGFDRQSINVRDPDAVDFLEVDIPLAELLLIKKC